MAIFRIGVDSSSTIDIYPLSSFRNKKKQLSSEHRNKNGTYKKYIWGHYTKFNMSLTYVPSSDTALINEWYNNNTVLILFENSQVSSGLVLTNKSTPLAKHAPPYDTLFQGELLLEGGF